MMKYERNINRKPDRDIDVPPIEGLTESEKSELVETAMKDFLDFYELKALAFKAGDDIELQNHGKRDSLITNYDIRQDGVIFFYRTLEKFDKSKYEGSIELTNTQGAKKPKTLLFYFLAFGRKETFHSFGMVRKDNIDIINDSPYGMDYDGDIEFELNTEKQVSEIINQIAYNSGDIDSLKIQEMAMLMNGNKDLVRFFFLKNYHRHTLSELKCEFGDELTDTYNSLSNQIKSLVRKMK